MFIFRSPPYVLYYIHLVFLIAWVKPVPPSTESSLWLKRVADKPFPYSFDFPFLEIGLNRSSYFTI